MRAETIHELLMEAVTDNPAVSVVRKKAQKLINEIREDGNAELADALEKSIKMRMISPDMGTYENYWNYLANSMHPDTATGGGKDMHKLQYKFLVDDCGLKKDDVFLDIGTGSLRGTRNIITYLNKGCFYGMDISEKLISFAKKRVIESEDMKHRDPNFAVDDRFRFSQIFLDVSFDFSFAKSVFTHVYPNSVWDCLVQLRKVISHDGRFYATIFKDNSVKIYRGDVRKMYYNTEWLSETASLAGWKLEEIGETKVGQYMCLFKPIS